MRAAMRARESAATAVRTIAATRANQKAQACNRPRSRGTTSSRANSSGVPTRTNYPPGANPMCAGSHSAEQALLRGAIHVSTPADKGDGAQDLRVVTRLEDACPPWLAEFSF